MSDYNKDMVDMLLGMHADSEQTKTRDTYVRSPIPYPGNKFSSLKHLIPLIPPGNTWIDGCGGSGVVSMNLVHDYDLKVFNDRNNGVTTFIRCLQSLEKTEKLIARLDMTVFSREDFIWCRDTWFKDQLDDVERAARWFYSVQHSFAGIGRNFGRATKGRAQADDALHNKLHTLREIRRYFSGFQVENLDVLQCIRDYASDGSVAYIDPDYIDADQGLYDGHKVDHKILLDIVMSSPGWFAVSNYKNDLYDSYNWTNIESWEVQSSVRSKAFENATFGEEKRHVMSDWETKRETLYIKDNRDA